MDYQLITTVSLPLLIFSVMGIWIINRFLNTQQQQLFAFTRNEERKQLITLRMQTAERLTLFLERISPESIVIREQVSGMTVQQFHSKLLKTIRSEYEHNLATQIYVSASTWDQIKVAKEEMTRLVNMCASQISPQSPSIELGRIVIEQGGGSVKNMISHAIQQIRSELNSIS